MATETQSKPEGFYEGVAETHILNRLSDVLKRYEAQSQASVPFLIEQIRLVQSNDERLLEFGRRLNTMTRQFARVELSHNKLEEKVTRLERRQVLLLEVIAGVRNLDELPNLKKEVLGVIERYRKINGNNGYQG